MWNTRSNSNVSNGAVLSCYSILQNMELPSLNLPYTCNASESILQFEPLNLQISPNKKMAVLSEIMLLQLSNLAGLCVFLFTNTCIVMGLLSYSSYFIHSHIKYWHRLRLLWKCRRRFTMFIFIYHQNSYTTFRWPSVIRQLKVAPSSLQAKCWLQLHVASPVEL